LRTLSPKVERIGHISARLGEGAFWLADAQALLWVDILGRQVHRTDPASGRSESWDFPEQTAFVQPADDGSWLVGQERGILRLDPRSGQREDFAALEADDPTTRTNDAACDPAGRLLVGTMRLPEHGLEPVGALYRLAGRQAPQRLDRGLYIPNGIAFSPEGTTAYWADTFKTRRQVWRASYDPAGGEVSEKVPFVQLSEDLGRPDGAAVDAAGCYWVAAVWGWQLLRYTPAGALDLAVRLPVQRPTKLAFGGPSLSTIFVTSASDGLGAEELKGQPLAGHLLALDVGIEGLPGTPFHLRF
jgi:sugar lactone lactonase YvrE